jgi:hypothetical protein
MGNYSNIKKGIKPKYERGGRCYADGGRIPVEGKRVGGKTVINIIQPPAPAPAGPIAPPMPPAPPVPPSGGPAAPPPAPGAGPAAIQAMQGFKRGGRVGKQLTNASGGAAGGKGRLRKARIEK